MPSSFDEFANIEKCKTESRHASFRGFFFRLTFFTFRESNFQFFAFYAYLTFWLRMI